MTKPKTPREVCKKGHFLANATIVVQRNGREACMACLTDAAQTRAPRTTRSLVRAKPRPKKPILTAFTYHPGLLSICQALYAAALEREAAQHTRAAVGKRGGKARKGKTVEQVRPGMVYGRGT